MFSHTMHLLPSLLSRLPLPRMKFLSVVVTLQQKELASWSGVVAVVSWVVTGVKWYHSNKSKNKTSLDYMLSLTHIVFALPTVVKS